MNKKQHDNIKFISDKDGNISCAIIDIDLWNSISPVLDTYSEIAKLVHKTEEQADKK